MLGSKTETRKNLFISFRTMSLSVNVKREPFPHLLHICLVIEKWCSEFYFFSNFFPRRACESDIRVTVAHERMCAWFINVLTHSEDYYGDLDLKTIRKSELLAGLSSSGSGRRGEPENVPAAPKAAPKPRAQPRPAASPRPQPPKNEQYEEDN